MTLLTRRGTLLGLVAGATLAFCLGVVQAAEPVHLTFVLTNDVYQMNEVNGRGGLPRLAAVVKAERSRSPNVIFTHAGDTLSPSLMSGFDQGAHMVDLFNALPPDVFVPGNHEFDFGRTVYLKRMGEAKFPVVVANLRDEDGSVPAGHHDTLMLERGGVKIGILGTTLDTTPTVSATKTMRFASTIPTIQTQAQALRAAGADLVVAVIHADKATGRQLLDGHVVDIVLQGHNHDLHIDYDGRTALAESGEDADFVVAVDVDVEIAQQGSQRSVKWRPRFRIFDTADVTPDPAMLAKVKVYEADLSRELDVEVGTLAAPLDSTNSRVRGGETAIGNFIGDAMRVQNDADVALFNGGSIRANRTYVAGAKLTRRDILTELPFGNKIVVTAVTGAALKQALEYGVAGRGAGRFPQVSGIRAVVDSAAPAGSRVQSVEINGAPLDPAKTYRVATLDFIARGGDGYTMLADPEATEDSGARLLANDVMAYARKLGTIDAKIEGRLQIR